MAFGGYRPHLVIMDEIAGFAASSDTYRGMDGDDQLVEVNDRYGYAWSGEPLLEVGDLVVLPGTNGRSWWVGKVTNFGSSWTGQHTRILRKATPQDIASYARAAEEGRRRSRLQDLKKSITGAVGAGKRRL